MSQSKEVVREAYGDAAKESANNTSCCGPSCCNAESTSDRPKNVSSEKYGDEARQAENSTQNACCGPSCCG